MIESQQVLLGFCYSYVLFTDRLQAGGERVEGRPSGLLCAGVAQRRLRADDKASVRAGRGFQHLPR